MPPKAQAAQQEEKIQLKTLMINLSLSISDQALEQFQNTFDSLVQPHAEYIEFVSKPKLKLRAVEAGLLNDPELLNEKQKKDPKFMQQIATCPSEMNAEISFKCLQTLVQEIVAVKSDPKLQQQKQNQKKETKKDAKKDSKVEEEVQEKRIINNFDLVFIMINLPENQEELDYFFENDTLLSQLILYTKQKTFVKESPDFIDTLTKTKQILEDDLNIDLNQDFAIFKQDAKDDSSQQSKFKEIASVIDKIKDFRSKQDQQSEFRNLLILENQLEIQEDETDSDRINLQARQHFESIVNYTEKVKEYQEFKSTVRTKKVKESEIEEDPNVIQYHKKQLQNTKDSYFGIEMYLESLLDEVVETKSSSEQSLKEKSMQESRLKEIFKSFDQQILEDIHEDKQKYVNIYSHNDKIVQQVQEQKFHNGDIINERVKELLTHLQLPGINRYLMPDPVSENLRKAKQQMVIQLIKQDFKTFSHSRNLTIFERMLKKFQPKRNWDLTNRIFTESLTDDELRQSLNESLLLDSHTLTHYDEDYDRLYLCILYKNPPGRILRKQWKYQDKILPNLQYYYKMKNVNHDDLYYDEDCMKLGNISEKMKYLYPMDQALIYQKKQQFGENVVNHCGVVQESYNMGISESEFPYIWMKLNHSDQRLTIESKEEMSSSLTLNSGLMLKFLPNGDIVQTMQSSNKILKRNFSDIVSPYDDNANYMHVEISRVITKHGNIIKTMKDGKKFVYLTNGNIIVKQNQLLTTTNNYGKRFKKRINADTIEPAETIEVNYVFDIESQSNVQVRGDRTIITRYCDQSQMIVFPDRTQIYQKEDTWIITHPDYATVKIRVDKTKQRLGTIIGPGSAFASVGKDDIMMRTFDGRVVETFLENGTRIVGYLEKKETEVYQQYMETFVNLYYFPDNTVVKVQQNDIAIIGGNNREQFDDPAEYFLQLFCLPNERKQGVYTGDMKKKILWTKDKEGNHFELYANGRVESLIAVSFDMNKTDIQSPEYSEDEYFDIVNEYLPLSLETIDPEFYVINNDNTAEKIYSEGQVDNYFRLKKQEPNTEILVKESDNGLKNYQILKKLKQNSLNMIDKQIPKVIDTITKTSLEKKNPEEQKFLYRYLVKYGYFDKQARDLIKQDLENIENYQEKVKVKRNQNVIEKISYNLQEQEDRIQMRLYKTEQETQ